MQVGAGAGLSGGFRSDTLSIANVPTSMIMRVAQIYRRIEGEWYLVVHRYADFPPSDQRARDQGTAGSGRA